MEGDITVANNGTDRLEAGMTENDINNIVAGNINSTKIKKLVEELFMFKNEVRALKEENIKLNNTILELQNNTRQDNKPKRSRKSASQDNQRFLLKFPSDNAMAQNSNDFNNTYISDIPSNTNVNMASENNLNTIENIFFPISNNNISYNEGNNNTSINQSTNKNLKNKKIFQILNSDIKTIKNQLNFVNCDKYTIKQNSADSPIKLAVSDPEQIQVTRDALKHGNISCHDFKLDCEKSKCFIIRGLVGSDEEDLPIVKNCLVNAVLPDDIKLSFLITGHMRANPSAAKNTLIKMILPPNCDTNILKDIKYIDHVSVKFEVCKSKGVIQCKNCQRFGHTSSGCMHNHRCPRTTNTSVKLY